MKDKRWEELGTRLGDALVDQTETNSHLRETQHSVSNHGQVIPTHTRTQNRSLLSSPAVKATLTLGALYVGVKVLSEVFQSKPELNEVEEQILASR